jgi:hypothetical protein
MFKYKRLQPTIATACQMDVDSLFRILGSDCGYYLSSQDGGGNNRRFAIKVGSMPIVGVCHLDTVLRKPENYHYDKKAKTIVSPELDDRAGFAALILLQEMFDFTIVCCDDEEIGQSTASEAADWLTENKVPANWIFELDRRGTEAVTYDYSCPLWDGIVANYMQSVGQGSFSDICRMESLGVKGFNAGIGYYKEHSLECHLRLAECFDTCKRVARMIGELHQVPMVFDYSDPYQYQPKQYSTGTRTFSKDWTAWDNRRWEDLQEQCLGCQTWTDDCEDVSGVGLLCPDCVGCMFPDTHR